MPDRPTVYHIPVCPFSQRLEVLLELKGLRDAVAFQIVDVTRPRDPALLALTQGTTALPILHLPDGRVIKESLVILRLLEQMFPHPAVVRDTAQEQAIENSLIAHEAAFTDTGYGMILNQNPERAEDFRSRLLGLYRGMNDVLRTHSPDGTFLFDSFGMAEVVFAPLFMRFWFLDYYENFVLPEGPDYDRVARWRAACLSHPAAQQVTQRQIVTLYYDYAKGIGNGGLLPGRTVSSFVFSPDWHDRPLPPRDKYTHSATDAELGLV